MLTTLQTHTPKRANTTVARAKSLVSPYFTKSNFAFAYA
jgi:hypothetical protein